MPPLPVTRSSDAQGSGGSTVHQVSELLGCPTGGCKKIGILFSVHDVCGRGLWAWSENFFEDVLHGL